ncbi:efflux RND transporter permease subunit [Marivirga arenosa]|uniref:Efflux RND transporter permease subunit n=1 Tax=Marivirga arenosa TaxID=3059076 RepID=A0AA52EVT3_9BACT|nr:efflux RND transporter permease subunit [Marivirga sp. BKB1-2]WNB17570.1 efflux RND transporter permease subunit [Marivirga sp. BKB1-2]
MLNRIIKFFLYNKLVTFILLIGFVAWGIAVAPFGWNINFLPSNPVPVDAIPNYGEDQQIVFTEWKGRSPQDIEDQISYPLTTYLLGIPGVKTIRSSSIFGFSSIYIIFDEENEFYWTRSRILEKLNSIPQGLLPEGVQPSLGPDATSLGQVYWYTIEGRDQNRNPTGGWNLDEIRSVQDYYVKYGLNAAEDVSEVASIGGFVKEYQIDVNPNALKIYNISLNKVLSAVKNSNRDVGAKTIEINQAEYLVRGLGYIKNKEDIESAVVAVENNTPIRIKDIASVSLGPATRRGILDKDGAEVVGGVVVARYGANPLQVINNVKTKIKEIAPGLPSKTLTDGTESKLTIVPFYDRSDLIYETLNTLEDALSLQVLISILVITIMVYRIRASLLISSLLPIAILIVFIVMRYVGITANIVALSGIAIAIGTMVDLGIILTENIIKHLDESKAGDKLIDVIYRGASEVSGAILTAVSTTIVSFIPVFSLQAAEGKLFSPLAFTKTFALVAALLVSLLILPALAHLFFGLKLKNKWFIRLIDPVLLFAGLILIIFGHTWSGVVLFLFGIMGIVKSAVVKRDISLNKILKWIINKADIIIILFAVLWLLAEYWLPLGPAKSLFSNFIFVGIIVGIILSAFILIEAYYKSILHLCLEYKKTFLTIPSFLILIGIVIWLGFNTVFGFVSSVFEKVGFDIDESEPWITLSNTFPGIGEEFMPSLNEGSFLLMPTSMPHSGVAYNRKVLGQLDMILTNIPEVDLTVGKLGRAESALDPAPVSMFENIINYKPEFILNKKGERQRFKINSDGNFYINSERLKSVNDIPEEIYFSTKSRKFINVEGQELDERIQTEIEQIVNGNFKQFLISDKDGLYFRNWRDHIKTPDDIWNEITKATKIPGVTSAPKLQPIETRLVMLQTGMRAPMGIKVFGPDLRSIEKFSLELEDVLKEVNSVKSEAVFADRIVGKPYMLLDIDRQEIARYGLTVEDVQQFIETAIGGMVISNTVEGRERFPVRVRYPRELRDNPENLSKMLISTPTDYQIPLGQIVDIKYERGPQAIKSENTFLVGYVLFDKKDGFAEVTAVEDSKKLIQQKMDAGEIEVPTGVNYKFSGSYENQIRAEKRLSFIVPIVLLVIFLILYFQFKSVLTSMMVFTGIALAFSGGFIMLWLYDQSWFLNIDGFGINFRSLFQIQTINLSVAVWVGFIALFGIATDDGVVMATYLDQSFAKRKSNTLKDVKLAVIAAGQKRIKPAVMTSTTTIIALLPILTSTGKGSDIMVPMAIPAFGGMLIASITYFLIPVLYAIKEESKLKKEMMTNKSNN